MPVKPRQLVGLSARCGGMKNVMLGLLAAAALSTAACEVRTTGNDTSNAATPAAQPATSEAADPYAANPQSLERARALAAAQASEQERTRLRAQALGEYQNLNVLVDLSDRELRLMRGDQVLETHPVTIGSKDWPTPTGSWEFHRVDINPEWIPPKEKWAEKETRQPPGAPDNPMGRARLVYRMPNTVHGTDDLAALGKASSHGSIRVANDVAVSLAQILLQAGGAWEGPGWFDRMTQDRSTEYEIDLPNPIPIKVQD